MKRLRFRFLSRKWPSVVALVTLITFLASSTVPAWSMNSMRGGALPQPVPLFPPDNWWNQDISNWPVDANSASFISFINNGGTRRLHPDFGGNAGTGNAIYGMPYATVKNITSSDLKAVQFQYSDESDGVDHATDTSFPFYPIPPEAITQPSWIEGGDPGNIDLRSSQDRHLLIVDKDRNHLYELYNVFYNSTQGKWYAGSGAFFDMNTNSRRPDTWTSADAAGLAILPGLVRYDEVYDPAVTEIRHAFRVTVRATNGYVYPASHRAGSTAGALPMGARLRLRASVDVEQRTSDVNIQKIFRAMQRYGLIVADNGSDMYITGTHDTRWNNDILNPAFRNLTASDFEVIQLGYNPPATAPASLTSLSANPSSVTGRQSATGTVTLSGPAPTGGAVVSLASANPAASVPSSVAIPAAGSSANFTINTSTVSSTTVGNITATYGGVTRSATLTVAPSAPVAPAALSSVTLNPKTVVGGSSSVGTVTLDKVTSTPVVVALKSSKPAKAIVPASITVPAGASSVTFNVATTATSKRINASISATYAGVTRSASLTIVRR
ncbi:MAG TPA: hypothetical protein VJQ55_11965 [Candidatus Binatia bacterium]|nr:hypothetical protein [Candidatus Binatia bacterium]